MGEYESRIALARKCAKVIQSCTTREQEEVARSYVKRVLKRLPSRYSWHLVEWLRNTGDRHWFVAVNDRHRMPLKADELIKGLKYNLIVKGKIVCKARSK